MSALVICAPSFAVGVKDVRLMPISPLELQQAILHTPLYSSKQEQLTLRAFNSGLSKIAYEQYTLLWKKVPNDGYANLRRGVAALRYWRYATQPSVHEIPVGSQQDKSLYAVASSCLEKASKLMPDSADANAEYGFLLWQFGNRMSEGLTLIVKASSIEPANATIHSILGDIYSNPTPGVYKPQKAASEIATALHNDPSYAYPHYQLARLYMQEKKYSDARNELKAYINLGNASTSQSPGVVFLELLIGK